MLVIGRNNQTGTHRIKVQNREIKILCDADDAVSIAENEKDLAKVGGQI